ncbi:IclR family transcriptional regulator [Pelagibius litoralis]|uniref:IclR family transcriptional regulator n=1 Tax=Pelagibius litoralis TaxID=374515 RepID=A0A967F306_9PROT|nr:IclR family transcriptional regulator [Pelagibius litoralis]NIA72266.1 IclR family transcriptional regulator [Pelagibius litoralis]
MAIEQGSEPPRSVERLLTIIEALSNASANGLRLTDVVEATGLGKTTAHRLLNGLADQGLVDCDSETGRYFVGIKILSWASAARNRFSIARLAEPVLIRLARRTQDTVYLIGRVGDESVCLDSREGSFPIKALTLNVGDRRPLGIGAGSLAMLAAMPDDEIERILVQQAEARSSYSFSEAKLREMIEATRRSGYGYNDVHIFEHMKDLTGMAAVAVAIRRSDGTPVAALHVTSVTARLAPPRRENIVAALTQERAQLEEEMQPALDATQVSQRTLA